MTEGSAWDDHPRIPWLSVGPAPLTAPERRSAVPAALVEGGGQRVT
jgi:hypothetical protein